MIEVIFEQTGSPLDVLMLKESEIPLPQKDEVLIRVTARNINPSDLLFIQGIYGISPKLPSSAGFEASGVVEEGDLTGKFKKGERVMFTTLGTWREWVCVPVAWVVPVPDGMPDEVACQVLINPLTAYGMLEQSGLGEGDWLLITAGASAFGKFAVQMAKARGIKVAMTVRHEEQKELLMHLGADLVINTEKESLQKLIFQKTETGVQVVFDAVGGILGAKAFSCLSKNGKMIVFGSLSLENMPVNSGLFIFKNLKMEGFWLSTWLEGLDTHERRKMFHEVFEFLMKEDFQINIEGKFHLEEFRKAIKAYEKPGRNGKILLVS
ncbi:zinc-dependent alcohol dehydrogenase family protein [Algoriphagus sp. CAU 1675]|uniref:zinc-dependent alcohol dehydrogenase family protein n=1 Tax=Algoriphagus sp. CAU 1675 TaxID=3032597 RepID=UPI0023DC3D90|nr:zinc-dependent alcohol dehydrogenase family protein [Algoriphagus sp. CAU 1675]MDF2157712.1 zinc-dependent alcohol dehydrogenase family protein [Algoriphagus sp. CAU 1675]